MLGSLALLIVLVLGVGFLIHLLIPNPPGQSKAAVGPDLRIPIPPMPAPGKPTYEVYPQNGVPSKPLIPRRPPTEGELPLVAIIIDDIGYDRHIAAQFIELKVPLTLSMLPYGPFSQQIATQARAKGHEIMLHLPMEPNEYPAVKPGPGALLANMSPDELLDQLGRNLDQFPDLKGVNNHMGSRISTSSQQMRQIFSILKKRGLYYIDSRTTAETVALPSAQLLQLPFAERDIFIDHLDDPEFIRSQLFRLIKRAQRQGYAVGIAHPHPTTHEILNAFIPRLKAEVALVPASEVVQVVMYAQAEKSQPPY